MKVVIDGDQLPYSAGFVTEGEPIAFALQLVKKGLQKILNDCGTEDYELYIAGEGNFREEIATSVPYKGTRPARKPEHYAEIRQYMQDIWGAVKVHGMEVDDKVSMVLWEDYVATGGSEVILSSPDKDLNNTPGWHYNPTKRKKYFVTEEQSDRHFLYQLLTGDTVDNIKGLPHGTPEFITRYGCPVAVKKGVGAKSAKAIMEHDKGGEEVYRAYCMWGKDVCMDIHETYEYMKEQGQLLWMLREEDDFGYVMWEPSFLYLEAVWND